MSLIALQVGHRFAGGPWLFHDLSHVFEKGCITAVVGPSGTGKSTLLQILAGTLRPSAGQVTRPAGCRLAVIAQTPHGVAGRTVRDHLALPLLARGDRRSEANAASHPVAARFGLAQLFDAPYRQLSGGEAGRLMLATAVLQGAEVILADEPTASLDAANAREVTRVLGGLCLKGATVVIATHDERVWSICDEVLNLTEFAVSSYESEDR